MRWFPFLLLPSLLIAQSPSGTWIESDPAGTVSRSLNELQTRFPGVFEDRADLGKSTKTLPPGKRLFWTQLDDMARLADANLRILPTRGKIQFLPGEAPAIPTTVSGPFRLCIPRLSTALDVASRTTATTATFDVAWEPGLRPFYLETRPQNLKAFDAQKMPLKDAPDGSSPVSVDGRMGISFEVRLPTIPRSVPHLTALEGTLSAVVPTKMVAIELPTLAALEAAPNAEAAILAFPAGGPAGRVVNIVRGKDRWTLKLVLPTPPGDAVFESYQSWVVQNEMMLVDREGKRWPSSSYLLETNTPTRSVVSYHFLTREAPSEVDPARWKVRYVTPAGLVRMDVPFRFGEIPLP